MHEKPILFSAPMVRAILEGRKTQTRRVVKFKTNPVNRFQNILPDLSECPFGQVGNQLWVREAIRFGKGYDGLKPSEIPTADHIIRHYEADGQHSETFGALRPSIFMPRFYSRIQLEITGVRVERLQDISEDDARAEGVWSGLIDTPLQDGEHKPAFKTLWDSINGDAYPWWSNPWVWVVEFQRVKP